LGAQKQSYSAILFISHNNSLLLSYEETIKDIEKTFGTVPGFMKETTKDILSQVWPLFRKYQLGESIIPQKYREMMMLAAAAAAKCPYCQTYHKEVSKMWGATDDELKELAAVVALTAFWSNVLHTQNYEYDTFVRELKQMGEYMTKNKNQ
jgi:AhpD family alkylhydroperoxidase